MLVVNKQMPRKVLPAYPNQKAYSGEISYNVKCPNCGFVIVRKYRGHQPDAYPHFTKCDRCGREIGIPYNIKEQELVKESRKEFKKIVERVKRKIG